MTSSMDHNNSEPMPSPTSPPVLDPPFRGYIETTYDALLVFEAARRGMIPRVTRRLIERERGMVQSGAVFVFDEHESGIKRWTDGLVWSPSRILGNFLVYRETDKRRNSNNGNDQPPSLPYNSSPQVYPQGGSSQDLQPIQSRPGLSAASITGLDPNTSRSRCASDAQPGESLDKTRERQLVGSLTNSYKFKEGGLVKKTMSVNVNGFAQHMVSYYSVADVLNGRLRTPSSISELVSLEISPEYMQKQNFRFPPVFDVGPDGLLQYKGELDETQTQPQPQTPYSANPLSGASQGSFGPSTGDVDYSRPSTASAGVLTPLSPSGYSYPQGGYFEQQQNQYPPNASASGSEHLVRVPSGSMGPPPLIRQASDGSVGRSSHASIRSSSRRYDPYSQSPGPVQYPSHLAKSPAFHAVRSPSLPDDNHRSPSQSTGAYLPVPPDHYAYRDMSLPPALHAGIPASAPGHFSSFPEVSPAPESYQNHQPTQQHLSVGHHPPPMRPSSAATVRHFGSEMNRSFSSPGYQAPPPAIHDATAYPPGYWVKREPDAVDELAWDNTNKHHHMKTVEYGAVRY